MTLAESDTFRNDGALINALTGLGVGSRDKTTATSVGFQALLVEAELESLYTNGIPRRYVDAIGDEILRHRPTITLGGDSTEDDSEVVRNFEQFLQTTQFFHSLAEVIKLQRLYGGAGLVLLIDDGGQPDDPVEPARIRAIRGYVPLSRHELIPEDFSITDYSRPSHYRITTSQRITPEQNSNYVNIRIHHTRVARFDGLYLPWYLRSRNTGWGQSVLQLMWSAFKRYETAMSGLETMTSDSDIFVHKIPGLFNRVAAGNESDLRKRLEANNLSRSVYGGMVVDVEEENQVEVAVRNQAAAGLAGQRPAGLHDASPQGCAELADAVGAAETEIEDAPALIDATVAGLRGISEPATDKGAATQPALGALLKRRRQRGFGMAPVQWQHMPPPGGPSATRA